MPPQTVEDEIFRKSTMTFGEHLEELRSCLFKAVCGLAVGFVLGLLVGSYVVRFIELPLLNALKDYYDKESVDRAEAEAKRLASEGQTLPWTDEEVRNRVYNEGLQGEERFIDLCKCFRN